MANCSSLGLRSRNRASSPGTWSNGEDHQAKGGGPFCVITRRILRLWTCSLSPTIGFDLLYAFVIVRLDRRELVWINVTANPTAEWVARQITEAFPWDFPWGEAPLSRSRPDLWQRCPPPIARHGHPGQAHR